MSLPDPDMVDAISRNNIDKLKTLVSLQTCDTQALLNSLLSVSIKHNKTEISKFLLQIGSNPNSRYLPLHFAARNGNLEIIETLLSHGADINAKDSLGIPPLVYAIENKKEYAFELLLERGARLFSDNEGRSPLHIAVTQGTLKITKMVLKKGAAVNTVITAGVEKGYTPLHCACSSSKVDIDIIKLLLSNRAGVDLMTKNGLTPLHIASQFGNVQVIDLLLDYKSEINVHANDSYTPLCLAIQYRRKDAALLLINRGAKIDDEFLHGNTILSFALERRLSSTVEEILTRCPDPQGEIEKCKKIYENLSQGMINSLLKYFFDIEFLHIAIREGYIQIIESVLKDRLDLTANFDDLRSIVHIAVKSKQIKSVEVLVAHGAEVNAKDETGMTPLLYAILDLNVEMTKLLISLGSDVQIAADNNGKTALHMLASLDDKFREKYAKEIAKMLLAAGADVNATTKIAKLTPLHVSCEKRKLHLVEAFLEHNADVDLKNKTGRAAIHIAASKCETLTKYLLENKANISSQDFDGWTALHIAIASAKSDVIKLLLKYGADINIKDNNNNTPMDIAFLLSKLRRYCLEQLIYVTTACLNHAFALDAINLYFGKDLRSSLSNLNSTTLPHKIHMESHLQKCKKEIEGLKSVKVPGYKLTCYTLMTRSIHSLASYVKNENLITNFASDEFTTKFPIYTPIIQGRLRNAFQRRAFIVEAGEFFNYYFQLPHVCIDHILSFLSSDDLKNVIDAM